MENHASPPSELAEAVAELWRLASPGPKNLFSARPFIHLRETCERLYPNAGSKGRLSFALDNALRTCGLPSGLGLAETHLALSPETAAARLDEAFRRTEAKRVHLCPLDLADQLPVVTFGPNRIQTFTPRELEELIDLLRLKRFDPRCTFDAKRFSEFTWLVVAEVVQLDSEPGERAVPALWLDLSQDLGRIEPHSERFPAAVEAALFALLLLPWEDWANMAVVDWRGFRVPWVYTIDDDAFVRPSPPPSPDTLSWQPDSYTNYDGESIEVERPMYLPLADTAGAEAAAWLNDATWSDVMRARQSPLLQTPVAHFLVRALLAEGIDEFLAHITVIEAALGMRSDYGGQKPTRHKRLGATDCVSGRVSGLLGARVDGEAYRHLFDVRSQFLHGRTMNTISSTERNLARRLARRTVSALVSAALTQSSGRSREDYLEALLDAGVALPQTVHQSGPA